MKNVAHVKASFYLLFDTDLNLEEFQSKSSSETIVGSEVYINLPNGNLQKASLAVMEDSEVVDFEDNSLEEKESPSCELDDKIAI